ncbi:MAG: NAD(P)-dependent oxidoreductase [Planctomycetota bacterium]|nr:MAG: NAD(P)-dependent oxidoreductase [Planctomycetota bacterium]RLS49805.1 MAG: NAD(P)-dependent oxidoreductase [Planctomycetota bacterium]HAQ66808.1 oxidoreductase [Phycisphaerales bacterium]
MAQATIGWIGTGVMGVSMAKHLMAAGHPLVIHTRTRARAEPLLAAGAQWAESPLAVAEQAEIVCSMVGYPEDVEVTHLGPQGTLSAAKAPALLIDFTTSSPALAQRIAERGAALGTQAIDAPVSGGDIGARNATLSIMCGGTEAAFQAARPVLDLVGKTVVLQGPAGAGQHTKMVNQLLIAGTMLGMAEALSYAKKAGLNPETVLQSVGGGAAASWSLTNLAPRILKSDFAPGFFIEHFLKDLRIALDEARALGLDLPCATAAERTYRALAEAGYARAGTQAIVHAYGW